MSDETLPPVRIKFSWLVGIVAGFAIFALIGAYSARMTRDYSDYNRDQSSIRFANLRQVRADEGKLIHPVDANGQPAAEWIDQDKGTVRIPIEQAMALEVDTLKAQAPALGQDIPGAAVPATPPPAAAAAPPVPTLSLTAPLTTNAAAATVPAKHAKNESTAKPEKKK